MKHTGVGSAVNLYNYDALTLELLKSTEDFVYSFLGDLLNNVGSLVLGSGITALYTVFWFIGDSSATMPLDEGEQLVGRGSSHPHRVCWRSTGAGDHLRAAGDDVLALDIAAKAGLEDHIDDISTAAGDTPGGFRQLYVHEEEDPDCE